MASVQYSLGGRCRVSFEIKYHGETDTYCNVCRRLTRHVIVNVIIPRRICLITYLCLNCLKEFKIRGYMCCRCGEYYPYNSVVELRCSRCGLRWWRSVFERSDLLRNIELEVVEHTRRYYLST